MLLATTACRDSSEEPANASSSGDETTASTSNTEPAPVEPAPVEPAPVDEQIAEPAPETPPPVPEGIALVLRILETEDALATAIDPARGLLLVRYEEAGPGEGRRRRETKTQQHLCGAAMTRKRAEIIALLRTATEQAAPDEEWTCSETECIAPGMEWTPTIHIALARDPAGALVIEGLFSVSEAALPEEWTDAANAYVARALTAARAAPCPAPRTRTP
jgi:hypothetical protein